MEMKKKLAVIAASALAFISSAAAFPASAEANADSTNYDISQYSDIVGDLNADDDVTVADLVILDAWLTQDKNTLNSIGKTIPLYLADMNLDSTINVFDSILLKRTILGVRDKIYIAYAGLDTEPTTEATDATEETTTDVTEATDATEVTTTDVTEATEVTEVTTTDVTEATEVTEVTTTDVTEATDTTEVTATDVTEATEVTEVTTTDVTETTEVTEEESAVVTLPCEIKLEGNTGTVEKVSFKVESEDIGYQGGVLFYAREKGSYVVFEDKDAVDGVITVEVPEDMDTEYMIDLIQIQQYWPTDEAILISNITVTIDGVEYNVVANEEEKESTETQEPTDNTDESETTVVSADISASLTLGEGTYTVDGEQMGSVTENGDYTVILAAADADQPLTALLLKLDGLTNTDYENLAVKVSSIKIDDVAIEFDPEKVVVDYDQDGNTVIYILTGDGEDNEAAAIASGINVSSKIEIVFNVSGIE